MSFRNFLDHSIYSNISGVCFNSMSIIIRKLFHLLNRKYSTTSQKRIHRETKIDENNLSNDESLI